MRHLLPLLAVAAACTTLVACGGESAQPVGEPARTGQTTAADCRELVPDSVLERLGWSPQQPATLDSATCRRSAPEGEVSLMRRAVGAVGGDDLPARARAAYAERCAELDAVPDPDDPSAPPSSGEETDWLGRTPACVVLADGDRGETVLLLLTDDDALVEARVDVVRATDPDTVRAGLIELARVASTLL